MPSWGPSSRVLLRHASNGGPQSRSPPRNVEPPWQRGIPRFGEPSIGSPKRVTPGSSCGYGSSVPARMAASSQSSICAGVERRPARCLHCPPTMRWPGSGRPRTPPRGRCRPRRPKPSWHRSTRRLPSSRRPMTRSPRGVRPGGVRPRGVGLGLGRPAGRVEDARAADRVGDDEAVQCLVRVRGVPMLPTRARRVDLADAHRQVDACGIGFVPSISAPLTWSGV